MYVEIFPVVMLLRLMNMIQVLDTPEPLRNLAELIAAQLEFHKKAYEILSDLAPEIDQLQVEQEVRCHSI